MTGFDASRHRGAFTDALERAFGMAREDAEEIADAVLDRFTDGDEVDDEALDADLRSVFYTLEAKRMVSFRRVEYTRDDGDRRRAFFWKLRVDTLLEETRSREIPVQDADVYAQLPASAWRHAHAG